MSRWQKISDRGFTRYCFRARSTSPNDPTGRKLAVKSLRKGTGQTERTATHTDANKKTKRRTRRIRTQRSLQTGLPLSAAASPPLGRSSRSFASSGEEEEEGKEEEVGPEGEEALGENLG